MVRPPSGTLNGWYIVKTQDFTYINKVIGTSLSDDYGGKLEKKTIETTRTTSLLYEISKSYPCCFSFEIFEGMLRWYPVCMNHKGEGGTIVGAEKKTGWTEREIQLAKYRVEVRKQIKEYKLRKEDTNTQTLVIWGAREIEEQKKKENRKSCLQS